MQGGRKCPETSYVVLTNACSFIVVSCKPVLIVFVIFHFSLLLILRDLLVKKNFLTTCTGMTSHQDNVYLPYYDQSILNNYENHDFLMTLKRLPYTFNAILKH